MNSLENLKVGIRTFILSLLTAISVTFSGTLIWSRFLLVEEDIHELEVRIEYVDARVDRRLAPIEQDINEIKEKLNK